MHRRNFIRNSFTFSSAIMFSTNIFAERLTNPHLIVSQGDSMPVLLEISINAMGGYNRFNLKGKRILIKPTIQWDAAPESHLNTNPDLIEKLIDKCYENEASEVYVLEHTIDDWRKCYKHSGIERATKLVKGKILPANDARFYKNLNSGEMFHFHNQFKECDLLINVPKLNFDNQFSFSGAIKNLHGLTFENAKFNSINHHKQLASILKFCKPVLNIIDASIVAKSKSQLNTKVLIVGENIVYTDAYASQMLDIEPNEINFLKYAAKFENCELNTKHLIIQHLYT